MSIKRILYKYTVGFFKPIKYAQKIGVNMRGGYISMDEYRGIASRG